MYEVGRLCVKTAGRDAGMKCVIIEVDSHRVLVDGQTRRKKVNLNHLLPLDQTVKIAKGASHAEVKKALEALGIEVRETKPRKAGPRPGAGDGKASKESSDLPKKGTAKPPVKKAAVKKAAKSQ